MNIRARAIAWGQEAGAALPSNLRQRAPATRPGVEPYPLRAADRLRPPHRVELLADYAHGSRDHRHTLVNSMQVFIIPPGEADSLKNRAGSLISDHNPIYRSPAGASGVILIAFCELLSSGDR